jgi:hypothetical protein
MRFHNPPSFVVRPNKGRHKQFVAARGTTTSDVVLITDLK